MRHLHDLHFLLKCAKALNRKIPVIFTMSFFPYRHYSASPEGHSEVGQLSRADG